MPAKETRETPTHPAVIAQPDGSLKVDESLLNESVGFRFGALEVSGKGLRFAHDIPRIREMLEKRYAGPTDLWPGVEKHGYGRIVSVSEIARRRATPPPEDRNECLLLLLEEVAEIRALIQKLEAPREREAEAERAAVLEARAELTRTKKPKVKPKPDEV